MDDEKKTDAPTPIDTLAICDAPSVFVNRAHIHASQTSVRFVMGEEVRPGVVAPKLCFAMPVGEMMKLAKSLNDMVNHYMNEARNAQRIVVPGQNAKG